MPEEDTKEIDKNQYLEKLKRKIIREMKTFVKSEKGQVRIKTDEKAKLFEIYVPNNWFKISFGEHECKIYTDKSQSYIIVDQPNVRIMYRKMYVYIEKAEDDFYVVTNQDIHLDEKMRNVIKEKDVVCFYSSEITELNLESEYIEILYTEELNDKSLIRTNDTLIISEEDGIVYLPYTADDLERDAIIHDDLTIADIISKFYTMPIKNYKNPMKARFKEAYNLMRKKERKPVKDALFLGLELMFESNLHPAIISACRDLQELDIYLDCLDDNEIEKFSCFKIIYKSMPLIAKIKKDKENAFSE